MTKKLQNKLFKKYPKIFSQRKSDLYPIGRYGIECDDGWYDLIEEVCGQLQYLSKLFKRDIIAAQVKEKYGGLRFYTSLEEIKTNVGDHKLQWSIINNVISTTENASLHTCELCGTHVEVDKIKINKVREKTLCKKCAVIELL